MQEDKDRRRNRLGNAERTKQTINKLKVATGVKYKSKFRTRQEPELRATDSYYQKSMK